MMAPAASVWTIETGCDFSQTLVSGILARYGAAPLSLIDVTLLLPNRRAVRTVQRAFLRAFDARATLLPKLMVLGEEAEDGLDMDVGLAGVRVPEIERIAILCRLIAQWQASSGTVLCEAPAHQVRLAKSLARLFDQSITEGLDFADLAGLVPDDFAHHWQQVLQFLEIVTAQWPSIVAARAQHDGAMLRREALERQAARWRETPPQHPVIAAGSTGSIPATAHLLKVIAQLPQGHVVLPGLNAAMPDQSWDMVREGHPQGALKRLLETLDVPRASVGNWHGETLSSPLKRRLAMIDAALSPASAFQNAVAAHASDGPLPGVHLAQVDGERVEASLIALVLRETLETPAKTAALITPDRTLARRVAAQLKRWGIEIDDSAGASLLDTPPAQFMRLVAAAAASEWAPVPLLSLLKHPFFQCGFARLDVLSAARKIDTMLRGPRRSGGLGALECADPAVTALMQRMADIAAQWRWETASLDTHLRAHMAMAQAFAEGPDGSPLFEGNDGNALALWCDGLLALETGFEAAAPEHYAALFEALMEGVAVRSGIAKHPRLSILGTIEARMTRADVMVLGGLNDGTWPPAPAADPWMNEPMRVDFGLPPAERRIGLSAHDFVQACGAPEVWITRTTKSDGAPTLASRWIARLEAAYGDKLIRPDMHIHWAETLDAPAAFKPRPQPAPKPPLSLRPRNLSVSDIERWMRDPYALYAKRVLKLEPLQAIDEAPGAADRGSAIHDALEHFFKDAQTTWPSDPKRALMAAGEKAFADWKTRPGVWALWWPRFEDLADWVLREQANLERSGRDVAAMEMSGKRVFQVSSADWTIRAKADRMDVSANGLIILDYKTGGVPSKKALAQGYAPQLPLEGLIAQAGGFNVPTQTIAGFEYWALGTTSKGFPKRDDSFKAVELMEKAEAGLIALFSAFSDPKTAYLHAPSPIHAPYKDYDDLARPEEWRDVPEAGGSR